MDETSESIGELKARVAILEAEVKGLRDDVRELLAVLHAGKGGWKTLMVVGTIATGVGATVATVISWFR